MNPKIAPSPPLLVYVYEPCSTCRRALRFLHERSVPFTTKDIKTTPPVRDELEAMLLHAHGNIKKLFNTSGLLYREMQLADKLDAMARDEALALLQRHGMLVRRPCLIGAGIALVGFNEQAWLAALRSGVS